MSYLLDTDTLSHTIKRNPSVSLLQRIARVPAEQQFTSSITVGELIYGAYRSDRSHALVRQIEERVLPHVGILPFDTDAAYTYGRLKRELERWGQPLPEADLRIACIALAQGMTLVTGNVRHFSRIPDLKVENWIEDQPAES